MRIKVVPLDQMGGHTLDPFRFDLRRAARIEARGFSQFSRHHPFRLALLQPRAREDRKLDGTRAEIDVALLGFHTDITEQASEQGAMNLLVTGGRFIEDHPHLGDLHMQLAVHIAPFTHATRRQKCGVQIFEQAAL